MGLFLQCYVYDRFGSRAFQSTVGVLLDGDSCGQASYGTDIIRLHLFPNRRHGCLQLVVVKVHFLVLILMLKHMMLVLKMLQHVDFLFSRRETPC